LNHGCQEKGQEKGWKEEGREEEVGRFNNKRGNRLRPVSPFVVSGWIDSDGRSKMEDRRNKRPKLPYGTFGLPSSIFDRGCSTPPPSLRWSPAPAPGPDPTHTR
jgi:hypothetical protein